LGERREGKGCKNICDNGKKILLLHQTEMDVVYLKGREKREEKWMQNCGDDAKKKFVAASNRDASWYFKWRERERELLQTVGDDG
jgi:hypothetical protein